MNEKKPCLEDAPDVEYFQELADGAPVMIWMSGHDMGCFFFNRAWLEYRGRTTKEEYGNKWAEGVHPDDLERCVQEYVGSFEKRVPFVMSYRLQHHSGEYRWILDRGVPHYSAEGKFLGYYGGCAEMAGDIHFSHVTEIHRVLIKMREFAECVASREMEAPLMQSTHPETLEEASQRLAREYRVRQNAAAQLKKLALDMLFYEDIKKGTSLH